MSKTEQQENQQQKVIINGKEYTGNEITPEILMGAIQAMKLDTDNRFKKLATNINKESGHINLIDENMQNVLDDIQGFNNNFVALKEMIDKNTQSLINLAKLKTKGASRKNEKE